MSVKLLENDNAEVLEKVRTALKDLRRVNNLVKDITDSDWVSPSAKKYSDDLSDGLASCITALGYFADMLDN